MQQVELHTVVALLEDVPDSELVRGQVGTVVEDWATGIHEVKFSDDTGMTYGLVALKAEQLLDRRYEPIRQTEPA